MNRRGNGVGLFEVAYTNEPNMHIRNPLPICNFPSVLVHTLSIITHTHTHSYRLNQRNSSKRKMNTLVTTNELPSEIIICYFFFICRFVSSSLFYPCHVRYLISPFSQCSDVCLI